MQLIDIPAKRTKRKPPASRTIEAKSHILPLLQAYGLEI